jgi:hypothetical protein
MDAYWNHFFHAADLAPRPSPREGEPLPYPDDTPVRDLLAVAEDPDPPFGMLDGVTPEELARARIAKHKEILTPPEEPPATRAMLTAAAQDFTVVRNELAGIQDALGDIRDLLAEIRDAIKPGRP